MLCCDKRTEKMSMDCSFLLNNSQIELLSSDDFAEIVEVWEASVRATHHFLSEKEIAFYKPLVLKYALPEVRLLGVRMVNKLIGFIGVSSNKVEMLFIAPEFIGKGLGKQLLTFALKDLHIFFIDVNEENPAALGFYQHMGYEIISRDDVDGNDRPHPILHLKYQPIEI